MNIWLNYHHQMVNTEIRCDSLGIYILCKFQNFQRGDSTICLNEMLTTGQTLHGQRKGHKSAVTVANMQMKMQRRRDICVQTADSHKLTQHCKSNYIQ